MFYCFFWSLLLHLNASLISPGETPFIIYAVLVLIAVVSIWFSIYWIESNYAAPVIQNVRSSFDTSSSGGGESGGERVSMSSDDGGSGSSEEKAIAFSFTYDPNGCVAKYHRFSHAVLSGILGAQSVLLGKSTAELLKTLIAGRGNLFLHFGTYVILGSMITCIVLQVHYLNEALQRVEATIVVPVFQTFWTLVSVAGGFVM